MKFEYECGNFKSSSSKTVSFLRVVNIADVIKKSVHQLNTSGLLVKKSNVPDNVLWILLSSDKYLLLAEFLVRTVNYGASFFPSIDGPSAKCAGHKSMEKNEDPYFTERTE